MMDFDLKEYEYIFEVDKAFFFWHGMSIDSNGARYSGQDNAIRIAKTLGGKTLEMCLIENREKR